MRVLIAPDSFKGTHTADAVARALGQGFAEGGSDVDLCPIADGGEGSLVALSTALNAESRTVTATDPLGRAVEAAFALAGSLGIVESAAASGLWRVAPEERDALAASTYGTGQLIARAAAAGAKTIYVAVGGTATTDGGAAAIQAIHDAGGLRGAQLVVLCDVRTAFEDAAAVFSPQKGADPHQVVALSERLGAMALSFSRNPTGVPMTGAAGGLAGGLWADFGAQLVEGAAFVLDAVNFDMRLRAADAVVTGEGRLDTQTLAGKVVSEVSRRAHAAGVPAHAVVGVNDLGTGETQLPLSTVIEASTLSEIEEAGRELARLISSTDR